MPANTTLHIELGTGFWLFLTVVVAGLTLWATLGTDRLTSVIKGSVGDAFRR